MSKSENRYEQDQSGLFVPKEKLVVGGVFDIFVNGELVEHVPNLVTTEGLTYLIDTGVSGGAQLSSWYITAYKNNVSPAATWTAANFNTNAGEITATDVSEVNRQQWVDAGVAAGVADNYASKAQFTVAQSTLALYGVAFASALGFGATTGTLLAATSFGAVRNLVLNDVLGVGYRFTATSA